MSAATHAATERMQRRWVLGALAIALAFHLAGAWLFGWYRIPAMEIPSSHRVNAGPFTLKRIEINPADLDKPQENPIAKLPVAEPPANPSQFNLDPHAVEHALQMPQPSLSTPPVPEPSRVIAATELSQGLPYAEADTAKLTSEIAKSNPAAVTASSVTSSKLAQDLISATPGPAQPGLPSGTQPASSGGSGQLPGFAELAPGFRADNPDLSKLPEPILLRLPSDVLFDFDSARLKPEAEGLLTQAVAMIAKYPDASIQVDGYSDALGQPDYNQTLSQQRAEAVEVWLQTHATQGSYKFRALGHGSTNFIASPQGTIEQQQPNRRVEVIIQALKAP